ncbi:MAG: hypothetical protein AABZ53_00925 [Planctomycetota bacterium]
MTLALLQLAEINSDMVAMVMVVGCVLGIPIGILYTQERNRRLLAERRVAEAHRALQAAAENSPAEGGRDAVMFALHRQMNELTIAKLKAEVQLLETQASTRDGIKDREEAGKEYHELMVEKAKLEIDSLRLHIAELRKRMDDWTEP